LGIRALERQNREGLELGPAGRDGQPPVPSISVNCKMLAARCSLSARSVRTHLDLLLKMGAITAKAWHGTRADFELWINPRYLWQTPENTVENAENALSIAAILQGEATKFPLSVAFETPETRKLETSAGEKVVVATTPGPEAATLATLTGNTGPQAEPQPAPATPETAAPGPRRE
ncbi:hypothetical protein, partial [Hymenobacter agri]